MLVSILVIASISYVAILQQPDQITSTYYEVRNFDSYHAFASYLQTSNQNMMYNQNQGNGLAPNRDGSETFSDNIMAAEKDASGGQLIDYSKTNVQVPGVDEPDIVKTDGTYLYIVSDNKVIIMKADPEATDGIETTITVADNLTIQNIFVNGTRLVIFTQSYENNPIIYGYGMDDTVIKESDSSLIPWYNSPDTYILIYDLTTINAPEQVKEVIVGGYFSNARLIGDYIYVITTQYTYNTQTLDDNISILPRITLNAQPLDIPLSDIYFIDSPEKSSTLTNIVSINIHDDDEQIYVKIFLLGTSQTVYVSLDNIYITTSTWLYYDYTQLQTLIDETIMPILPDTVKSQLEIINTLTLEDYQKQEVTFWVLQNYSQNSMPETQKEQISRDLIQKTEQTILHRIHITEGEITYIGQGSVPGYINNQFSFDEYNGYLRISTTLQGSSFSYLFGSIAPETNLYVLDMDLHIVGSLEDITPDSGESIYATRFVGSTCYIVTYKQTDPFIVIDLSDPTTPVVLGKLEIPGYSTYLHPYDDTHMIGIGRDNSSVKISLYDISDISSPVEVSRYIIENKDKDNGWWTDSTALYEHKAFLFDKEKNLLVIPAGNYSVQSAYVFNISLDNGLNLKGVITHDYQSTQQDPSYYWGPSGNSIQRTLFIGDVLYTISENMVQMNDLKSLTELNNVLLVS